MQFSLRNMLAYLIGGTIGVGLILSCIRDDPRIGPARRSQCRNSLKQISIALSNYHLAQGGNPPVVVENSNDEALYSWRVLISPYAEHPLQNPPFDYEGRWDSAENVRWATRRPYSFQCPGEPRTDDTAHTSYVAVRTTTHPHKSDEPITPVLSSGEPTCIVEWHRTNLVWTAPENPERLPTVEELMASGKNLGNHADGFHVLWEDGTIEFIRVPQRE